MEPQKNQDVAVVPLPPSRFRRGDLSDNALAFLLILPAAVLLGGLFLYPLVTVFWTSLHLQKLAEPYLGNPFVGLQNFLDLTKDFRFRGALWNTLYLGVLTVLGSFAVGIPIALIANQPGRWRTLARVALLLPWAMPPVFSALMFAWMFNGDYGVFNAWITGLGLEAKRWLVTPSLAVVAFCVVTIWKTSSFVGLLTLSGLQGVPKDILEAAEVDGASKWQSFWRVLLPLLAPALSVALIFRTLSALQVFDIPYTLTQGGPDRALETLGILIYRTIFDSLDFGASSAMCVTLFALGLAITFFYVRFVRGD
jgi:multiple sugar transport system permease protein